MLSTHQGDELKRWCRQTVLLLSLPGSACLVTEDLGGENSRVKRILRTWLRSKRTAASPKTQGLLNENHISKRVGTLSGAKSYIRPYQTLRTFQGRSRYMSPFSTRIWADKDLPCLCRSFIVFYALYGTSKFIVTFYAGFRAAKPRECQQEHFAKCQCSSLSGLDQSLTPCLRSRTLDRHSRFSQFSPPRLSARASCGRCRRRRQASISKPRDASYRSSAITKLSQTSPARKRVPAPRPERTKITAARPSVNTVCSKGFTWTRHSRPFRSLPPPVHLRQLLPLPAGVGPSLVHRSVRRSRQASNGLV